MVHLFFAVQVLFLCKAFIKPKIETIRLFITFWPSCISSCEISHEIYLVCLAGQGHKGYSAQLVAFEFTAILLVLKVGV